MTLCSWQEKLDALNRGSYSGKSLAELKPEYAALRTYDLCPDTKIFRILPAVHLLADIKNGCLKHSPISAMHWKDRNENPLLNRSFRDEATGGLLTLGMMGDIYASCWTMAPRATRAHWSDFSYGQASVRIGSTVGKLIEAVMDPADTFYGLSHSIGRVTYHEQRELVSMFGGENWLVHVDDQGYGIDQSVLRLGSDISDEREVRLICHRREQPWICPGFKDGVDHLPVPMGWRGVLHSAERGPFKQSDGYVEIEKQLEHLGLTLEAHCEDYA